MATPPPPPRNIVLVHVSPGQVVDERVWRARRVLLAILGWRGTVGLCPLPSDSSAPGAWVKTPAMTVLSLLGVERAHGVRGLGLDRNDPNQCIIGAAVRDLKTAGTLEDLQRLLAARGGPRLLDQHLDTLLKRVRERWADIAKNEALFIVSEHSWLLLALAERLCVPQRERERLQQLPLRDFPDLCAVHANGYPSGPLDLSPRVPISWYLDRA